MAVDERLQVVSETLRFLASGWVESRDDQEWLAEVADQIDARYLDGTCPLCQEITCDGHCPLSATRSEGGSFIG